MFELNVTKIDELGKNTADIRYRRICIQRNNKIFSLSVNFNNIVQILIVRSFELHLHILIHAWRYVSFLIDLYGKMRLCRRQDVKSLGYRRLVDYLEAEHIQLVDFIAIKFNLGWIELDVYIAVSLLKWIYTIEEPKYFFIARDLYFSVMSCAISFWERMFHSAFCRFITSSLTKLFVCFSRLVV